MDEIELLLAEVNELMSSVIRVSLLTIRAVITEVAEELSVFVWNVSWGVEWILTELVDIIYDAGLGEWHELQTIIWMVSDYLFDIAEEVAYRIEKYVAELNNMLDYLIVRFDKELSRIDNQVTELYQQRIFAIYGRIGELSIAINAPPSYLEDAIQNAKIFALSVSSYIGLSWSQFQIDWDTGLNNLLNRISNSIEAYKLNPQQIKVDLEQELIKPAYEIKLSVQRERAAQTNLVIDDINILISETEINQQQITEIRQEALELWELTIEPALLEITENFENWQRNIYQPDIDLIRGLMVYVFRDLRQHTELMNNLSNRFNFAGDILQRIDLLPETQRLLQEAKITEVSSRTLRTNTKSWMDKVSEERIV